MQYLIIKSNRQLSKEEQSLLIDALKEVLGKISFEDREKYYFIKFDNNEVNIHDLFTMINSELFLDVRGFSSLYTEDQLYINWTIDKFLNSKLDNCFYYDEKALLRGQIILEDEAVKKSVLKDIYNDKEYYNLLKVFFECNLNTSKSAELLYMHRNTLINKIDRFYELTGYDLKKFEDAIVIYQLIK